MPNQTLLQTTYQQINQLNRMYTSEPDFNHMSLYLNVRNLVTILFSKLDAHVQYQNMYKVINDFDHLQNNQNCFNTSQKLENDLLAVINEKVIA